MEFSEKHRKFMSVALNEAKIAFSKNEIPIGAVLVKDEVIISKAHNLVETLKSPINHAEIIVIQDGLKKVNDKFLTDCTLYCTLEPCSMCAGAMINARLTNLVFGALDIKNGASGSIYNILNDNKLNHSVDIISGVMDEECSDILKEFFIKLRDIK